ncbi:hypothetical protein [Dechloromonas sp. ZS-1]|uniref:hypothetical protein n=1 Tax=Dechloromonas sp. ZS-1 TaxID=3138067 RepID=UPI0031FC32B7
MMNEKTAKWWGAVITMQNVSDPEWMMKRPAAFLFDKPGGFAWLEPSYADEYPPSSPAWHEIEAELKAEGEGFTFVGRQWTGRIDRYDDPEQEDGEALYWWITEYMKEKGRTPEQERAAVIQSLELN